MKMVVARFGWWRNHGERGKPLDAPNAAIDPETLALGL